MRLSLCFVGAVALGVANAAVTSTLEPCTTADECCPEECKDGQNALQCLQAIPSSCEKKQTEVHELDAGDFCVNGAGIETKFDIKLEDFTLGAVDMIGLVDDSKCEAPKYDVDDASPVCDTETTATTDAADIAIIDGSDVSIKMSDLAGFTEDNNVLKLLFSDVDGETCALTLPSRITLRGERLVKGQMGEGENETTTQAAGGETTGTGEENTGTGEENTGTGEENTTVEGGSSGANSNAFLTVASATTLMAAALGAMW